MALGKRGVQDVLHLTSRGVKRRRGTHDTQYEDTQNTKDRLEGHAIHGSHIYCTFRNPLTATRNLDAEPFPRALLFRKSSSSPGVPAS